MNNIKVFSNKEIGSSVRTITKDGEPWFVLTDVCKPLGIKNATDVAKRLDKDELARFNLGGRPGVVNIVNESGMYAVVLRSDKPTAKKFRKWITSEVLPAIRKTGGYQKPQSAVEQLELHREAILEVSHRIDKLEQDMPLLGCDMDKITTAVKKLGVKALGGKNTPAYLDKTVRGKVYHDIYEQLKRQFGVSTYKNIKRVQLDQALETLKGYKLPIYLQQSIEDANSQMHL